MCAVGELTEDARRTNETVCDALVILAVRKGEDGVEGWRSILLWQLQEQQSDADSATQTMKGEGRSVENAVHGESTAASA